MLLWIAVGLSGLFFLFVVWLLLRRQATHYLAEYLFFTRYSILFGALLFFLPIAGPMFAPKMLQNVFVMDATGAGLVGFSATLYAWAVVYTFRLTWITIPTRCRLAWKRGDGWQREARDHERWLENRCFELVRSIHSAPLRSLAATPGSQGGEPKTDWTKWEAVLALLLAVPLFWLICWEGSDSWLNLLGVGSGVAAAFVIGPMGSMLVRPLFNFFTRPVRRAFAGTRRPTMQEPSDPFLAGVFNVVVAPAITVFRQFVPHFESAPELARVHTRAAWYFLSSFAVVVGLGFLFDPSRNTVALPSLVILLFMLQMFTWILGRIGFIFDKDRVPVALVVLLILFALQAIIPNTHTYDVDTWSGRKPTTASKALAKRVERQQALDGPDRPLVAVACSGGGIRASMWSALVLEELNEIEGFDDQLSLISSVSGGSLGSMYYYDRHVRPPSEMKSSAVDAASTPSLTALMWGIAYRDMPRLLLSSRIVRSDRGMAQETAWQNQLGFPEARLSQLADEVRKGTYPLHIYNACFQESGQRFLLAPVDIEPPTSHETEPENDAELKLRALDLRRETNRRIDMELVTAARLSATFPYASPQAKSSDGGPRSYHAADGGYYDNSGLLTVIEVLDRYLEDNADVPKQIAIVEIRADLGDFAEQEDPSEGGLITELTGPLTTAYNVVFNSQSARNRQEIRWIGQMWKKRESVELRHFVFYLRGGPLSWQLSEREKEEIRSQWPTSEDEPEQETIEWTTREFNAKQLQAFDKFMGNE